MKPEDKSKEDYIQFLEHKIDTEIEGKKICYRNLSLPLKTAVLMAYIVGITYGIFFLIGFFSVALGTV